MSEKQCNWSRHYLVDAEGDSLYATTEVWARAAALSSWRRDGEPFNRHDVFRYYRCFHHGVQYLEHPSADQANLLTIQNPNGWVLNLALRNREERIPMLPYMGHDDQDLFTWSAPIRDDEGLLNKAIALAYTLYSRSFRHELQFYGQLAAIPEVNEHAPGQWFAQRLNMQGMVRWTDREIEHGAHSFLVHWTNGAVKEIEYRDVGFVPGWNLYGELHNTYELTRRVAYFAAKYGDVEDQLQSLLADSSIH